MMTRGNFEIVFIDNSDCEHLLAQVRFKNVVLCEINKESGNDQMEVEIFCNDPLYCGVEIKFPLNDFIEAIELARVELMSL